MSVLDHFSTTVAEGESKNTLAVALLAQGLAADAT